MDGRSSVYSKKREKLKAASSHDGDDAEEEDGVDDDEDDDGSVADDVMKGRHFAPHRPLHSSSAKRKQRLHAQTKPSNTKLQQEPVTDKHSHNKARKDADLLKIMQKQNEIAEMLVKEQRLSTLPPKEISVFKGDPLTFIRTFEHCIEGKTTSNRDYSSWSSIQKDNQRCR